MTEKAKIMRKVGNLHQLVDVVPVIYQEGGRTKCLPGR